MLAGLFLSGDCAGLLVQAALPELMVTQPVPGALDLRWKVPGTSLFPMPVEVQVGDTVRKVAVPGRLLVAPNQHVVIDPFARVLKRSVAVEEYQAWQAKQTK